MCSTILSICLCQEGNKTYHKVSFSFEKFQTESTVDSICQPQRLETNKRFCLCELHFEQKYIVRGGKSNLKWSMNPIPRKHSKELLKMSLLLLPTSKTTRKPPRERLISNDQMDTFRERGNISSLADLNETTAPDSFQFKKSNEHALFL